MDVSTPPSVDPFCPQAKADMKILSTCLEKEVSTKRKYGNRHYHYATQMNADSSKFTSRTTCLQHYQKEQKKYVCLYDGH